jgi:hypothetical protein
VAMADHGHGDTGMGGRTPKASCQMRYAGRPA